MRAVFFLFLLVLPLLLPAQTIAAGFPLLEENACRSQILGLDQINSSFLSRPVIGEYSSLYGITQRTATPVEGLEFRVLPALATVRLLTDRPYGWGDYGMIPNPGLQTYFSGGVQAKYKFLNLTFRPELALAQNKEYEIEHDE